MMLRRYQFRKPAILGIAAALGLAAVSSAGMGLQLGNEGMNYGLSANQAESLTVLMNQNFAQSHGMSAIVNENAFSGAGAGLSSFDGELGQHFAAGKLSQRFNGNNNASRFFGSFSNSFNSNGNGRVIGDGQLGDGNVGIQGVPLPMSALLGLGGLIGMGLIRRYTR